MAVPATLTGRQLNRATLARQMLLAREKVGPLGAIERLAGLQAQLARPPFIGLFSRLDGFRRDHLIGLIHGRAVVRATMMRCTLHLVSANDYVRLRAAIQPVLTRAMRAVLRDRAAELDVESLVTEARAYLSKGPRTFEEIRDHLEERKLSGDERARGYAVRTHLPLVQVPVADSAWGYPGTSAFALADAWLGTPLHEPSADDADPRPLVTWYLAAFGPATATDAQTWSGFTSLRAAFEDLRPKLQRFRDERGRELYDLPDAPRPPDDVPAPVRFLPEFDNLVLAHDDRSRLIADEHRPLIFKPNLRILPTFLVDGMVAGTWDIEKTRGTTILTMEPFGALPKKAREDLLEEGNRLLRFVEPDARDYDLRFGGAPKKSGSKPRVKK